MKHVLVTGGKGQVGTELSQYRWPEGWVAVPVDVEECDLMDRTAIAQVMASRPWAAVINAGAYTAVDRAETDMEDAWAINALCPAVFAKSCRELGIPLVQISTDYVFDGTAAQPWRPDDRPDPLGVYGASKLGGEIAVRTSGARHAILRSSWVISAHGGNFVKTMLRLARDRESISVVDDQHGCPTHAADLAATAVTIATNLADDPDRPCGTWHFSNDGPTTWHRLATAIMAGSAARGGPSAAVVPISSSEYPTPAKRPANSVLDCTATTQDFGIRPRPWQEGLDEILDSLIGPRT